jgi:hypothetical protein
VNVAEIQEALRREGLDGWLFFDHHQREPCDAALVLLHSG